MRILVGTNEIAGILPVYADGFRRLGHKVTTVLYQPNDYYPTLKYDVDISKDVIRWPDWLLHGQSPAAAFLRNLTPTKTLDRRANWARLRWLMARHDIFFFQWAGVSLMIGNSEYPFLKERGKRIISVCNGDDVRHWSAYNQQCALLGTGSFDLRDTNEHYRTDPLVRPLKNLRTAERHSDLILSVPNQSGLAVRPYMRFVYPLDLSEYEFRVPGRETPIVVHAPSDKSVKGTDRILEALERLGSENVNFELRLLHGVPNKQVLRELRNADVAIDQLHLPPYGKLGAEAMASGCALATCNGAALEPFPPNRPIWDINPGNLNEQLKRLLTDKDLRIRLAHEGRKYVEHHDHVSVVRNILDSLFSVQSLEYDFYPGFFARHYRLPDGEVIPDALKTETAAIVERWGLAEGADLTEMETRGLISIDELRSRDIPRWKQSPSAAT